MAGHFSTDQLNQALMNGEIQTRAELQETIRRLAKKDLEGTMVFTDGAYARRIVKSW